MTLYNLNFEHNVPQDFGANVGVNKDVKLSASEKDVYNEIQKNNNITIHEIAVVLNKTKRTIERIIYSLKAKNVIKRIGSDKTGHWEIIDK